MHSTSNGKTYRVDAFFYFLSLDLLSTLLLVLVHKLKLIRSLHFIHSQTHSQNSSNPFWTDIWIVGFVWWWGGWVSQACVYFWLYVKCVMETVLDKKNMDADTDTDAHQVLMVLLQFFHDLFRKLMRCNYNKATLKIQSCSPAKRMNARLNVCPVCACIPCERTKTNQ